LSASSATQVQPVQVQVSAEQDSLRLAFSYNQAVIAQIKTIPGRLYDSKTKTWLVPKIHGCKLKQIQGIVLVTDEIGLFKEMTAFHYETISPTIHGRVVH
jgi:hypothetical protein